MYDSATARLSICHGGISTRYGSGPAFSGSAGSAASSPASSGSGPAPSGSAGSAASSPASRHDAARLALSSYTAPIISSMPVRGGQNLVEHLIVILHVPGHGDRIEKEPSRHVGHGVAGFLCDQHRHQRLPYGHLASGFPRPTPGWCPPASSGHRHVLQSTPIPNTPRIRTCPAPSECSGTAVCRPPGWCPGMPILPCPYPGPARIGQTFAVRRCTSTRTGASVLTSVTSTSQYSATRASSHDTQRTSRRMRRATPGPGPAPCGRARAPRGAPPCRATPPVGIKYRSRAVRSVYGSPHLLLSGGITTLCYLCVYGIATATARMVSAPTSR